MTRCVAVNLGTADYTCAWELQRRLHQQVVEGLLPNLLLLVEHPHVYTLGRRGKATDVLVGPLRLSELGVEVHSVDRGGEVTYHGPGQLVVYPIISLRDWRGGPLRYVRTLEEVVIKTLAGFDIRAGRGDKPTGVWVGNAKIAAIGVKVSRGVTMHGLALNVNPDLTYFDHIVPCGMPEGQVTSMASLLARDVRVEEVAPVLARHFGAAFGWRIEWSAAGELEQALPSLAGSGGAISQLPL